MVIVGKRYKIAVPPQTSHVISARTPTGSHVSHANALKVVHNSKGGGGKATRLERYTPRKGGKMGVGHRKATLLQVGKSVERGLEMVEGAKKVTRVPKGESGYHGGQMGARIADAQMYRMSDDQAAEAFGRRTDRRVAGLPKVRRNRFGKGFADDPDHPTIKAPAGSYSSTDVPKAAKFLTKKKVGIGAGVVAGGLTGAGIIRSKKKSNDDVPQLVGASKGLAGAAVPKVTGTPKPTPGNLLSGLGAAKGPTTPQTPKPPKAPVSVLNSNMPAGAKAGRRLP
jgi:hypothetical protein